MEQIRQTQAAVTIRGLEIRLAMAKEYRRFVRRVLPNDSEIVATTIHVVGLEWKIEDKKRLS